MRYTKSGNNLSELYLENSNVNWVEGSFHLLGDCVMLYGLNVKVNHTFNNDVLTEEYIFTNNYNTDIVIKKVILAFGYHLTTVMRVQPFAKTKDAMRISGLAARVHG